MLAIAPSAAAALPGRNGKIAFSYDDCGSVHCSYWIVTVSARGRGRRERSGYAPAFSPCGRLIAFSPGDEYGQDDSGYAGLFTGSASLRGRPQRLKRSVDFQPDWSRGGRIVFVRGTPTPESDGTSPRTLSYALRIHSPGRSQPLLTFRAGVSVSRPAWSARGVIAFTLFNGEELVGSAPLPDGIYTVRRDGSRLQLVIPKISYDSAADWSPSGSRLVFSRTGDILLSRANGTHAHQLTRGRADDSLPMFSPDGRWIAFVRNGGRVLVTRANGRRPHTIAKSRLADGSINGIDRQPLPHRRHR